MSHIDSAIAQLEAAFASELNTFPVNNPSRQRATDRLGRLIGELRGLYIAYARGELEGSLAVFARECLYPAVGHALRATHFYEAYRAYCHCNNLPVTSHLAFVHEIRRAGYLVGRYGSTNTAYIANVALENLPPVGPPLVLDARGRLVPYGT